MKTPFKPDKYKQARHFAEVTKELLAQGKTERAKKCLQIAEKLFINGSAEIRNTISNVYLHSVSCFMEMHHYRLEVLLPEGLRKEYYKHVNASGL